MALTAYCKKCNQEVSPGEICPRCGTKLPKYATHAAWVVERRPAADWMCWNAVLRWLIPMGITVLGLSLLLEWLSGGPEAVERLFQGSFPLILLGMALAGMAAVLLVLGMQGKELVDYVIDSRGVHATRYLPDPTPLKLIARLKSPSRIKQMNPEAETALLRLEESDLSWKDISRVQLWPEKCYILFYAPAWWLRLPVRANPFSWEDALFFVRDRLGRKKSVELPEYLRTREVKKTGARRSRAAEGSPRAEQSEPMQAVQMNAVSFAAVNSAGNGNQEMDGEKKETMKEAGDFQETAAGPMDGVEPETGQQISMELDFSEEGFSEERLSTNAGGTADV